MRLSGCPAWWSQTEKSSYMACISFLLVVAITGVPLLVGQESQRPQRAPASSSARTERVSATYVLATDDVVVLHATDVEEVSDRPLRIDPQGNLNLPLLGTIHAAGMTLNQFETEVVKRMDEFVNDPHVTVSIAEFRSQPVSVLGAVAQPGVHQLQGERNLFEVLSLAGGLRQDAGYSVRITRRLEWGKLPLPDAALDPSGMYSIGSVSVKAIMDGRNPQLNIIIKPQDVISVPKGELVYVIGSVKKAGGFVLGEKENVSVLQALSLAEGLDRLAAPRNAKILRAEPGVDSARKEIPVDLKNILEGKAGDIALQSEDILFVPNSVSKSATIRGLEAALQLRTGFALYRR